MTLELTPLVKSIASLGEALTEHAKDKENDFVRDACIQRFEFTYELSHKMLKRFLEMTEANPEAIEQMSFQDLIRTGDERGLLLNGWDVWSGYRKARGTTSHTYDETKAAEVFAIIPDFFEEAKFLLEKLQERQSET